MGGGGGSLSFISTGRSLAIPSTVYEGVSPTFINLVNKGWGLSNVLLLLLFISYFSYSPTPHIPLLLLLSCLFPVSPKYFEASPTLLLLQLPSSSYSSAPPTPLLHFLPLLLLLPNPS